MISMQDQAARAADLDCAREAWRTFPWQSRPAFGVFALNYLRERGFEVVQTPEPAPCCAKMPDGGHSPYCPRPAAAFEGGATCAEGGPCSPMQHPVAPFVPQPFGPQPPAAASMPAELLKLFHPHLSTSPHLEQALTMSVETIADLLAALAERGLRWVPGTGGACGELTDDTPPEPADLHVVFDAFRCSWQRDDERAASETSHYSAEDRWFGTGGSRWTWRGLCRENGPLTPDGGIAPTSPAGDDGCEGGIAPTEARP